MSSCISALSLSFQRERVWEYWPWPRPGPALRLSVGRHRFRTVPAALRIAATTLPGVDDDKPDGRRARSSSSRPRSSPALGCSLGAGRRAGRGSRGQARVERVSAPGARPNAIWSNGSHATRRLAHQAEAGLRASVYRVRPSRHLRGRLAAGARPGGRSSPGRAVRLSGAVAAGVPSRPALALTLGAGILGGLFLAGTDQSQPAMSRCSPSCIPRSRYCWLGPFSPSAGLVCRPSAWSSRQQRHPGQRRLI